MNTTSGAATWIRQLRIYTARRTEQTHAIHQNGWLCLREERVMSTICRGIMVLFATAALLTGRGSIAQEPAVYSDPGEVGSYAVGHTAFSLVDTNNGNRPVLLSVWYPVDPATITSSTPPAQYPLDPYTGTTNLPITLSTDWEPLGYDPAYEGAAPSKNGPFPLVVFSVGFTDNSWMHLFQGARLASHGYIFVAIDHYADCQWPWSPCDDELTVMVNRPHDVSFVITQLLIKSRTPGELLSHTIDSHRIAAAGHSLGGYATFALAGGDDLVCDTLFPALFGGVSLPYPQSNCVPIFPDERIKAMITLDGSSQMMRYEWLARISMPSLIMGETVDNSYLIGELQVTPPIGPLLQDWIARPHAAIDRPDSYRVDVDGANHYSFTNYCDVALIPEALEAFYNLGFLPAPTVASFDSFWPCSSTVPPAVTISSADEHKVVTKYMIAFLDVHLRHHGPDTWRDQAVLTPEYALDHKPTVQFFDSEECRAALPNRSYFTYRPHQTSGECDVAQEDPTSWFSPSP
jgi:predicted dienelactone hydrolase